MVLLLLLLLLLVLCRRGGCRRRRLDSYPAERAQVQARAAGQRCILCRLAIPLLLLLLLCLLRLLGLLLHSTIKILRSS